MLEKINIDDYDTDDDCVELVLLDYVEKEKEPHILMICFLVSAIAVVCDLLFGTNVKKLLYQDKWLVFNIIDIFLMYACMCTYAFCGATIPDLIHCKTKQGLTWWMFDMIHMLTAGVVCWVSLELMKFMGA